MASHHGATADAEDGVDADLPNLAARGLTEDGPLADGASSFVHRGEQVAMAQAVAQAIERQGALVVEAGTGVGKTFAYLVPVLLSGRRALLSTATKSLQDQLFLRDLPRVRDAFELPLTVALLKGRESYLCVQRLSDAVALEHPVASGSQRALARIGRWAQATQTGDLGEVEGLEDHAAVVRLVTSTRDNCLGSACPKFQACHVVRARREAMAADVVVVNHHLFFADMALRETGMAELLPTVDVVVFDEAHHLVDTGVNFLGMQLSTAQAIDFSRDALATCLRLSRGHDDWHALCEPVERTARDLRLSLGHRQASRAAWPDDDPAFHQALVALGRAARALAEALQRVDEQDPALGHLAQRALRLAERAECFDEPVDEGRARWIDLSGHHARLIETPLDIAEPLTELRRRSPRSWIFTSATLGEDDALKWFTRPTGLDNADEVSTLKLGSPYDHASLARLWAVADAPRADDARHPSYVGQVAGRCAALLGGRTIVLTTTLRALPLIAQALKDELAAQQSPARVIVQGEQPKRRLLEQLRSQPGTVLVASQSFWEGVDVPGDALQCVIIDKLPFPPPNDPLIEARARRVEAEGGSAFNACFLAEAAIALKQGAGRLIRSESDRGLLVVCDPRLATMPYGKRLLRAMPPMTRLSGWGEARDWLSTLAALHDPAPDPAVT